MRTLGVIGTMTTLVLTLLLGCGGGSDSSTTDDTIASTADGDANIESGQPKPPRGTPDPRAGWTAYRHPLGATLKHPPGWTTQETALGVALTPPGTNPEDEMLLLWGTALPPGAPAPDAPQAATQMDLLVSQLGLGLARSAAPEPMKTPHGPGAVFDYTGKRADGKPLAAKVYFTAGNNVGLGLTLLGSPDRIAQRVTDAQLIFTSMSMAGPAGNESGTTSAGVDTDDPRLIGAWATEAYAGGDGIHINTQILSVLNADGSYLNGARSFMDASQRDHNGNIKWTAGQDTAANILRGSWSAKGGYLTVVMDGGGRSVFAYGFEPDGTLALRNAQTRKLINIYSRVR